MREKGTRAPLMAYENIIVETRGRVALIRLNRPQALNALNSALNAELAAAEAERAGLVARVVPAASLMEEAMKVAETIASMSLPAVLAAKEAVNRAFETSLAEGIQFERRIFHALFATEDQKEGMAAFIEK